MTLNFFGRLAVAGCLVLLSAGCDDASTGGTGGAAGTGGAGGTQAQAQIPGLWEGQANGVAVCFYISNDGRQLMSSSECNITAQPDPASRSFDLSVDRVGTDENGDSCSFELGFTADLMIDQKTNSFRVSGFQPSGSDAELSFSGQLIGKRASGVARSVSDGSTCRVGWAATKSTQCDDAAIQSCLDLLDCCRAILVNPIFFESCNSVVLQCDQAQCLQALAGYPQCVPEPEPEPMSEPDAGTPDAG